MIDPIDTTEASAATALQYLAATCVGENYVVACSLQVIVLVISTIQAARRFFAFFVFLWVFTPPFPLGGAGQAAYLPKSQVVKLDLEAESDARRARQV